MRNDVVNDINETHNSSIEVAAPKVSVIMGVYNTEETLLKGAIDSILNQTLKELELIIVNDGSSNDIESVVKSYDDSRIRYYSQPNRGISAARNFGIEKSKGEYIAMMDSDDVSLDNRLEKQYGFLSKNKDFSVTTCWIKTFPRNEISKTDITEPKILDNIAFCYFNATAMFRKSDFEKYNLKYDETVKVAEDYELWSRACRHLKLYYMPDVLYLYKVSKQGNATRMKEDRFVNTIKIQSRFLSMITSDSEEKDKIIDIVYKKQVVNKNFAEQLFSIKNFLKFNKKYKVITVLGIEFRFLTKEYACD